MNAGPPSSAPHSTLDHCPPAHVAADCVLVHPAGAEPSGELRDALARHRIGVRRATSNFDALAQLAKLSRSALGRPCILLLAHPTRLDRPAELMAAAQRYTPGAACWVFDPSSSPRLRAATTDDAKAWDARPATRPGVTPDLASAARAEVTFAGPGFPGVPLAPALAPTSPPKQAAKVEPKVAMTAPPAPAPLKLAGGTDVGSGSSAAAAESEIVAPKHKANDPVVSKRPQVPGPKFVGGTWDGGASPFPGSALGTTPRQLLTDEELAMLLADGPTRPQS